MGRGGQEKADPKKNSMHICTEDFEQWGLKADYLPRRLMRSNGTFLSVTNG